MSAGGVAQRPRGRVEHHEREGGGAQRRHPGGERIGPPQHLPEVVLGGEQLGQHGAKLSHRRRSGDAVAHHVPDDERDGAAVQRDRIEPVAAGRLLLPGHQVPGRDPDSWQYRQGGGQQRLLEFCHDPGPGRVPALRVPHYGSAASRLVVVVPSTWHRRLLVTRPSPR